MPKPWYRILCGRAYSDFEEMLTHERPDAVFIATPEGDHLKPTIASVQQGCHLFGEKPLATTLQDAEAIIAASSKA